MLATGVCYTIAAATMQADIVAALTDRYGAYHADNNPGGYAELYKDSTYLVFKCASIAGDRVLLFYFYATAGVLSVQYGTSHVSGSTIANAKNVLGGNSYTNYGTSSAIRLVLHDETLFLAAGGTMGCAYTVVIGKLTNGQFGGAGFSGANYFSPGNPCHYPCAVNLTTNLSAIVPLFPCAMYTATGDVFMQPLVLLTDTNRVTMDGSDYVSFLNVLNIAHVASANEITAGDSYVVSVGRLGNTADVDALLKTSLYTKFASVGVLGE